MSKKKQKQLTMMLIVLAVVVVLLGAILLVNYFQSKKEEAEADAATPRLTTMEDTNELTFTNGDTVLTFTKTDDQWQWAEDGDFPLDDSNCTTLEELAADFTADQQMDILDSLDAYGLENPTKSLTLSNGEETVTVLIGGETGDLYYAMLEGGDQIFTIDSTVPDILDDSLTDMATLADYPILSSDIIQSVSVEGKKNSSFTVKEVTVEVESDDEDGESSASSSEPETTTEYHWFNSKDKDVTDDETLTGFRTELDTLSVSSLAYFKPSAEEKTQCGLDDPAAVVTVVYTDNDEEETSVLTIGGETEDGSYYYCTLDTNPNEIYLISASAVEDILTVAENGI
jgi:hypothetical protein